MSCRPLDSSLEAEGGGARQARTRLTSGRRMVDNSIMTLALMEYPQVLLTGPGKRARIPPWVQGKFAVTIATVNQLRRLSRLPELTIVRATEPATVLSEQGFLLLLAARHRQTPTPAKILFVFDADGPHADPRVLLELLLFFDRAGDVELARSGEDAAFALDEALAKIWAALDRETKPSKPTDPLGQLKTVIAATADLRSVSGRLSAQRVATAFGLSLAELAALIGRSRQTLWKTDDAESVQEKLFPFERIVRLRAVLAESDFRSWLNMPNDQLDEETPLALIRGGEVGIVADLAEDMLTGSPT